MLKNKKLYYPLGFLLLIITGCNLNMDSISSNQLNRIKSTLDIVTTETDLTGHFPTNINKNIIFYIVAPPSCPPQFDCSRQYGDVVLIANKYDYPQVLKEFLNDSILFETKYSEGKFIIDLPELKKNIFPNEKCNKFDSNSFPIPYFENYDFGMGTQEEKKVIDDKVYFNYLHNIPSDLYVYIIDAEYGNFWKHDCNETRPESLKIWKHGFSKGFALSDQENIIVIWTLIW